MTKLVLLIGDTYAAYNGQTQILKIRADTPLTAAQIEWFRKDPQGFFKAHQEDDPEAA